MKNVSDESGNSRAASSTDRLSDKAMAHLWKRMLSIYGHKWDSHLGPCVNAQGKLSDAAATWKQGLSGITVEQVRQGFDALLRNGCEWPPSLPEFREMCLQSGSDAPSLEEVVQVLVMVSNRHGSMIERYRHPLCLALARELDMYALRQASIERALAMVRPEYKRLMVEGWEGWPAHAHERQQAIAHERVCDPKLARQALSGLRELLNGSAMANG